MSAYRVIQQTAAHRYKRLVTYDYRTVHSIINAATILHVSFSPAAADADAATNAPAAAPAPSPAPSPAAPPPPSYPAILPMIGTMGLYAQPDADPAHTPLDLYLHGHASARLMRQPSETAVSVSAALLDGVVLALTPYNHNCQFRSAVVVGRASVVRDADEKLWAMRLITDGLVAGRWEGSRTPPTEGEVRSTSILKVVVDGASAKVNVAGPNNSRAELKDEGVVGRVWTGVVPVCSELFGTPVPCGDNRVEPVPEYLEEWVRKHNEEVKRHAGGETSSAEVEE
ncbi:flavin-nucleotide-binding protein [Diplodia corticola]|uniref:Flavin-nucleotide-binding protein n=1 Tax=Diplodia corticola TaxID=236234 RepID=A0A1J9S2B7_9PEZI|nr:flavin-nucleotide-binding protein [Diplodia corticola]OJD33789.1 flavin-nucleotide-binding protein [Diplodia corticola]